MFRFTIYVISLFFTGGMNILSHPVSLNRDLQHLYTYIS